MSLGVDGFYYVEHAYKFRQRPHEVQKQMLEQAEEDGRGCTIVFPQEVGAGGKYAADSHSKNLVGFHFKQAKTSGSKVSRFLPFSAAAEAGLVKVVKKDYYKDPWTGASYGWLDFLTDLEVDIGSRKIKDDIPDSAADSFHQLVNGKRIVDNIDISVGFETNSWDVA